MTILQALAYVSNFLLVLCAWRMLKARLYAGLMLASDLVRLALMQLDSSSLALYGIDGVLLMSTLIVLGWCLEAPVAPLAGLVIATVGLAIYKAHAGQHEALLGIYMTGLCVGHGYATVVPICSRKWRRNFNPEQMILIGLASSGFAGTLVMITWGYWDLAQAGNVAIHILSALLALLANRRDKVV